MITQHGLLIGAALVSGLMAAKSTVMLATELILPPVVSGYASWDEPVRRGENVPLEWLVWKTRDCTGQAQRQWTGQDGYSATLPIFETKIPVTEDPITVTIPTVIPNDAPNGALSLVVRGELQNCGWRLPGFSLGPVDFVVID